MSLETLIERLGARRSGREWRASCPNCNAGSSAVSIEEKEGRIVIHCFSCRDNNAILAAIGMTWRDVLSGTESGEYTPIQREDDEREKDEAARNAMELWESSQNCDRHPYLDRKRVRSFGLRVNGDMLLIPMHDSRGIRNLQRIMPDGSKRFLPKAQVTGCHYIIPGTEHKAIGEGYATCATVAMATGFTVVTAFMAGNLARVADRFHHAHILADDDRETQVRIGRNPGIDAAREAARITGGIVLAPPRLHGVTDWNDVEKVIGMKAVGSRLIGEVNRALGINR